jgi:murein DD-endopeptidase MepM/ murein hydrolase activator NlpD
MELVNNFSEYGKFLGWYAHKKSLGFGGYFETGKSVVVTILKARRGTYQKPFLHVGMVIIVIIAVLSTPVIVNEYPTAAAGLALANSNPSAALNTATDITNLDTVTLESEKPRRDVVVHEIVIGDTLSSIAKQYGVDSESIAYLNDFSVNKLLRPGDTIKIPPVSGVVITVKSGDTISSLAKKHGLPSAQPIVDWPYNTFANDETFALTIGQSLVIPGGKPPQVVAPVAPRTILGPQLFAGGTGQFIWPTGGVITQYYSWYHSGDDIANSVGTPIVAADAGRVTTVEYLNYGYGYHIIVDHGNGYQTLYGHLSRIDVGVGQNVSRGERVGFMGSTGRSTGSHLHFEVMKNGARVNPLGFLK